MDVYTQFLNEYVYTPERKLWIDFTRLDGGRNLIDTGEFEYPNLLTNSTFEATSLITWSATGDQTGNWAASNATEDDETSIVKNTVHSYKVTNTAAWGCGQQTVNCSSSTDYTVGGWRRADSGNTLEATRIVVTDNDSGASAGTYVTRDDKWYWDSFTHTTAGSATTISVQLFVYHNAGADTGDIAYFDGVILVEASSLTPTGWTLSSNGGESCHYDFFSKIGTYSVALVRGGNNCALTQDGFSITGGNTYAYGCWAWASVAGRGRMRTSDGTISETSDYHSGGSSWEFLTDEITTDSGESTLDFGVQVRTGDTTAYFDSPVLVEGTSLTPGWTTINSGEFAPTGDQYKIGSYSMRVVSGGAYSGAQYKITTTAYNGKNLYGAAWLYAPSTNSEGGAKIGIDDDVNSTTGSSAVAEDDAWHWATTAAHTVNAGATWVNITCYANNTAGVGTDDIVYCDGIKLYVEGGITDAGGHPINIMGTTPSGTDGWIFDGVDDYVWMTNAEMKRAGLDFTTEHPSIFVRAVFTAGTAIQTLISTRDDTDGKGYELVLSATEELEFNTYGASDISTDSAAGVITGTETATLSMSRNSVASVDLYKNGDIITDTAGTHVALTSSDEPLVVGAKADDKTLPSNTTKKCILILNRPVGAHEQADIARMLGEICP